MTQPPIVPGPYDPTQGWEAQPPASPSPVYYPPQSAPPGPYQPPPPQVVYVQASSPTHEGQNANAVTKGILSAFGWIIVSIIAVCVGVPAVLCLIGVLGGGLSTSR